LRLADPRYAANVWLPFLEMASFRQLTTNWLTLSRSFSAISQQARREPPPSPSPTLRRVGNRFAANYRQSAMRPGDRSDHPAPRDPVARTLRIGLGIALFVLLAQSAIGLVAALVLNSYDSVFDLDRNNGIPDLLSTAVIFAAALGAAELAAVRSRDRWLAAALALLLSLVALDDFLQQEAGRGDAWGKSVIVTLLTFTLLLLAVARNAPRRAGLMLVIGLCLLAVAVKNAYEYDQFLNMLGRGDQERGDLDYELGIVLKQGLEFVGWSLVAIGLWATALAAPASQRQPRSGLRRFWLRPRPTSGKWGHTELTDGVIDSDAG
jgi:hypothetical protein